MPNYPLGNLTAPTPYLLLALVLGTPGCPGNPTGDADATTPTDGNVGGSAALGGARSLSTTGGTRAAATASTSTQGVGGHVARTDATGGMHEGVTTSGGVLGTSSSVTAGSHATTGGNLGAGGKATTGGVGEPTATTSLGGSVATGRSATLGGTWSASSSAASSTGGASSAGTSSTESPILEPSNGALLGIFYGDATIAATTNKLGRAVPLHLTYYAWTDDWTRDNTAEDLRAGRIPFVNWELFGAKLDDIISGKDDAMIKQRAIAAKNLGKKLFVDFGAEMNGDWSPWSGALNGKSSAKYVSAYRHVHDIFSANGATNVIWAFCPNVTSEPDEDWNQPLEYYPGDSYVDWTCVDGYNWGKSDTWSSWQSFRDVFKSIYATLATKNKPIMIGEMASTELGGDKAAWISGIVPTLKTDFPLIKGLLWFDIDKETDWRISSSPASEAAFKALANDPWFTGR